MRFKAAVALAIAGVLTSGCATEAEPRGPDVEELDPSTPTYHGTIEAIVEHRCGSCHVEGGIGPVRLDDYDSLVEHSDLALLHIESGKMPPWMPSPECRRYDDERLMPAEEKEIFRRWVEAGTPAGDKADGAQALIEFETTDRPEFVPTHLAPMPEEYTPDVERPDDYRCFLLDTEFPEDTYLVGSDIKPGNGAIVHHVLVYALDESIAPMLRAADQRHEGPGYSCFGSPLPDDASGGLTGSAVPVMLAGWAPGSPPMQSREGSAIRIRQGSVVVMQVHYNTLIERNVSDRTELQMELTTERPERLVDSRPAAVTTFEIPAGDRGYEVVGNFTNYTERPQRVAFVAGHMHKLGVSITTEIVRGEDKECLLDIPAWDFSWQQAYQFRDDDEALINPGDTLRITCNYDNSTTHQPVVNGARLEPRDVTFGEGTLDEMCLAFLGIVTPYTEPAPAHATACEGVSRCMDGEGSALDDVLGCEDPDVGCLQCMLPGILQCGAACVPQLVGMRTCFESCANNAFFYNGAVAPCLEAECGEQYEDLKGCLDPLFAGEACRAATAECGLAMP